MDIIALGIGLVIGALFAATAFELSQRWRPRERKLTNITHIWSISEIENPLIVAQSIEGIKIPEGARIVTAQPLNQKGLHLRINNDVDMNFIVGTNRALILSGAFRPGTAAMWTVDEDIISSLKSEFEKLWEKGEELIEEVQLSDALAMRGGNIKTMGEVSDVIPYREGLFLIRITDGTFSVPVFADSFPQDIIGKRIEVTGSIEGGMIKPKRIRIL